MVKRLIMDFLLWQRIDKGFFVFQEISEKRDIVWNATYFLDYLLNSINITHVKNNLTTKANQQFKFARLPNEGILRNTNDSITFADMGKAKFL